MTFKDYLVGRRIVLSSRLDREAVALAIRTRIRSGFSLSYTGVAGWCRFGRVGLHWATAMKGHALQPTFRGKLNSDLGWTRLEARFGAPPVLLILLVAWYALLTLMLVSELSAFIDGTIAASEVLLSLGGIVFFLFVPFGFHLMVNHSADKHLERMLAALKEHAGFEETGESRFR